jgi:hypothetical protein
MKLSLSDSHLLKENTIVKRMLLVVAAAILFVNTLVVPTAVKADGGGTSTSCGRTLCKP